MLQEGVTYYYELLMTLYVSKYKIIGGSYEQKIRFYFMKY